MEDAARTWALVVAIDQYDDARIKKLTGSIGDAVAAINWLRDLGVPAANILVNASPVGDARFSTLGVVPKDASEKSIWSSIKRIATVGNGDRLFVFLSGHGIYDADNRRRVFLTQEYAVDDNFAANLDIEAYIDFFLSLSFQRQFLFFDGCLNYAMDPSLRSLIVPGRPRLEGFTPKPDNGLIACYAAAQAQRATELNGRGAMMGQLLKDLDLAQLKTLAVHDRRQNCIIYDWRDGSRRLNLTALFTDIVKLKIEAAVAAAGARQTPGIKPYGAAESRFLPFLELAPEPTVQVTIDVRPDEARPAVERINLHLTLPSRDRDLPVIPHPLSLPDVCHVPKNARVTLYCIPTPEWEVEEAPPDFSADAASHAAIFKLRRHSSPPSPNDLIVLSKFNVKIGPPLTSETYLQREDYDDFAQTIGPPAGMKHNEDGPDFDIVEGNYEAARTTAIDWARKIRTTKNVDVVIAPPRRTKEQSRPNLQLKFEPGWARGVAGFLREAPLIAIGRPGTTDRGSLWNQPGDYSAAALEDLQAVHVEPGINRVRIDLPWGSWTEFVDVPAAGRAVITMPESVGLPPLRNEFSGVLKPSAIYVKGSIGGLSVADRHVEPSWSDGPWTMFETLSAEAAFSPTIVTIAPGAGEAVVDAYQINFLLPPTRSLPLSLLVDLAGPSPRVEPCDFSPRPEWDLIISTGRLDAISPQRLHTLCDAEWPAGESWFLQLGLAYAACAAGAWSDLWDAVRHLRDEGVAVVDVDLLDHACQLHLLKDHDRDLERRAVDRLNSGEIPALRWGFPLARQLTGDEDGLLGKIEATLSDASVFSVWVSAVASTESSEPQRAVPRDAEEVYAQ
ncbi:MAG: hypothetical protein JWN71_3749 [Xanthobacteraceae bacterium]|nr:hypothetical protein [Xanthobacteraceae bacterium]